MRHSGLLALAILALVACQHKQSGDRPGPTEPDVTRPARADALAARREATEREHTERERASLLQNLDTFLLRIDYHPSRSKKLLLLTLAVRTSQASPRIPPTAVGISRDEARRIVDVLASSRFLYRGLANRTRTLVRRPPYFRVTAGSETDKYSEMVPLTSKPYSTWCRKPIPPILTRLRDLRAACEADAARAIDGVMAKVKVELAAGCCQGNRRRHGMGQGRIGCCE